MFPQEFVEVYETRNIVEVNHYLAHGYRLIDTCQFAQLAKRGDTTYTRKGVVYVVGRTEDVDHTEVPEDTKQPMVATSSGLYSFDESGNATKLPE